MTTINPATTPKGRLTAETLRKIAPRHVRRAVRRLVEEDVQHPFGRSTGYDLVTPDGRRLPPKAVFGLAIQDALGLSVGPDDFYGGEHTPCFAAIRNAGFVIEPKGTNNPVPPPDPEERAWLEGGLRRVTHLTIERSSAAARNKKDAFIREHGHLFCQQCGLVPSDVFDLDDGDAAIEVHHTVALSELGTTRTTTLDDLICLCANCHRVLHAKLRRESR